MTVACAPTRGVPKIWGTSFGVHIVRIIVYWCPLLFSPYIDPASMSFSMFF